MWDLLKYGNKEALVDDRGRCISYKELDDIQHKLLKPLIKENNRDYIVFILCRNTIESIAIYVSCIMNHIVPYMIPSDINDIVLEGLMKEYQPEYIWMPADRNMPASTVYEYNGYKLVKMYDAYNSINSSLALLLSTSGTTGSKKAVRISYENLKVNTEQIAEALSVNERDRAVTMLPMHYTYGLSVINTHLYSGATLLVTDKKIFNKSFWNFFNEYKGTSISGVAYTYKMLKRLGFEKWDMPSLNKMTQAGESLPLNMYEYLSGIAEKKGIRFYPMYGQTEATARITVMPEGMASYKKGSTGIALKGGIVNIVDENGQDLREPYKTGRIIYTGLNVAMGYAYSRKELAEGNLWKGRLDTGDYGHLDEEGYLYIEGRQDEYVKAAGNRISLRELEELLEEKFTGSEFCAAYEKDKIKIASTFGNGEEVSAFIVRITGLNRHMLVVKCCSTMPVLDNGKINRKFTF